MNNAIEAMLRERFLSVDYASAKADVSNFIRDNSSLSLWKKELFLSTLDELKMEPSSS